MGRGTAMRKLMTRTLGERDGYDESCGDIARAVHDRDVGLAIDVYGRLWRRGFTDVGIAAIVAVETDGQWSGDDFDRLMRGEVTP